MQFRRASSNWCWHVWRRSLKTGRRAPRRYPASSPRSSSNRGPTARHKRGGRRRARAPNRWPVRPANGHSGTAQRGLTSDGVRVSSANGIGMCEARQSMDTSDDLPPTEQENPRTRDISSRSIADIVGLINDEDARVAQAVEKELPQVAAAVEGIVARLEHERASVLRRHGDLGPPRHPRCRRVPADVWRGCRSGAGHHRRRVRGVLSRGRSV